MIAFVFVAGMGDAASKKVHPKLSHDQTEIQKSDDKKQSSPQPPIIVNVSAPQKTHDEIEQETQERAEKTDLDRKLVKLTGDLANYTLGLFVATIILGFTSAGLLWLGRKQIAVSDKSADAALKSANVAEQALLMAETPYLVPEITECRIRTGANNTYEVDLGKTVTYHINNYGRTPATIFDIYACLLPALGVPMQTDTTGLHTNLTMTEIIPPHKRSVDHYFNLNDGLRDILFESKNAADQYIIFFVGHIRFGDVFGNEYISGFCLARNGTTGVFYGIGGREYNYRRKIKSAEEIRRAPEHGANL